MSKTLRIEDLCEFPTVGPAIAQDLLDAGYTTYGDLAAARPMHLYAECNIVLSSTMHIIGAAVENLTGACPECDSDDIAPIFSAWTKTLEDGAETKSEVVCEDCGWNGAVDTLTPSDAQTTTLAHE